jgi:hypothetical protein
MIRNTVLALVAVSFLAFPACSSSDSDDAAPAPAGSNPAPTSVAIKAADGGTVATTGVSAMIPAGALADDTTITVAVSDKAGMPNEADIAAKVFDFGPNGTTFLKPVELTLDFAGAAPEGKKAVVAFLKDGAWVPLEDSAVSGGKVVAHTTHFTSFTVVFVAGQGQTGGTQCPAFTACGGDLTGTWSFSGACAEGIGDPFMGSCAGATASVTVDITGTITFNGDKTYSLNNSTSLTFDVLAPTSCFGKCESNPEKNQVATPMGDKCHLVGSDPPNVSMEAGTYAVTGTTLTTTKTGDTAGDAVEYCVTGSTLTAKSALENGGFAYYTATKQLAPREALAARDPKRRAQRKPDVH